RAATRNRVQAGIAQAADGVFNRQAADFSKVDDLRSGEAVQMNARETLLDASHHLFIPFDLHVRMQAALHQDAGAAQLYSFANLLVDGLEIEHVAFGAARTLNGSVEGTERAIFGAEIGVVDIAVDDVRGHAFRMKTAPHRVGFHADPDQIV